VQPGFVALVTPDGTARTVGEDIAFPNGMAVTADNHTLVVADSYRHQLVGFDINADGGLSGRRVWADLGQAAPDGICLDVDRAVWYADVPHQRCVRVAEGGEELATVPLDRGAFACMLGGIDTPKLYVVAARWPGMAGLGGDTPWDGQVLRTEATVPGAGWPAR
jgi:sugar lactone lactonase YvrE